jgi:trimethylamine--corrinoid protein Co-methyltransferase
MDNEFAKMIKFTVKGIPVTDETLAVDAIHEVGIGKDFISHETTYKHMRSASTPKLINRKTRESWEAEGATDIHQRSLAQAKHILENHKPDPIEGNILAEIRSIVEEAEAELGISKNK